VEDLKSISWPSRKQVLQTLFISQVSFAAIVVLVVVFDTVTEASVRWLLLGDPPTCAARAHQETVPHPSPMSRLGLHLSDRAAFVRVLAAKRWRPS